MLDKAEYSAFQSTLNSPIVSYRIVSVIKLFVNSKEFTKLCKFADVTPYDNIYNIRSQLHLKFNTLCIV